MLHAANSAAVMRDEATHLDMVRCGIAIYGIDPFGVDGRADGLQPALELTSYVAQVKPCAPGRAQATAGASSPSEHTNVAVVPSATATDGGAGSRTTARWRSTAGAFPIAGTISMDSFTVDVGPHGGQELVGAPVALIGGGGSASAEDLAARLGTIGYEITCALTARCPALITASWP